MSVVQKYRSLAHIKVAVANTQFAGSSSRSTLTLNPTELILYHLSSVPLPEAQLIKASDWN